MFSVGPEKGRTAQSCISNLWMPGGSRIRLLCKPQHNNLTSVQVRSLNTVRSFLSHMRRPRSGSEDNCNCGLSFAFIQLVPHEHRQGGDKVPLHSTAREEESNYRCYSSSRFRLFVHCLSSKPHWRFSWLLPVFEQRELQSRCSAGFRPMQPRQTLFFSLPRLCIINNDPATKCWALLSSP